ncbi:MAG: Arylsulfatase [Verrucomicrobiota bacterium]|jgi:arylsulfatase A-like enzyme
MLATALLSLFTLVAEPPPATPVPQPRPPNIVFILSDDAGYADFGFQDVLSEEVKKQSLTPALDKLASQGAVFTQAYVSGVVCSPSRAGLLTGRYQQRFGHDNNMRPGGGLPVTETLMPQHLAKSGYATECLGKWHLGEEPQFHPKARGFGHFFGLLSGSRSYLPESKIGDSRVFLDDYKPCIEEGYVTDRIGQAACASIRKHAKAGQPFFQYIAFTAPHAPNQPRPEDKAWLQQRGLKGGRGNYFGLLKALDENVAAIIKTLEEEGAADNTLIVFSNDNGGQTATGANNGILRGHKGEMWEGGSRVPFVVTWPARIKPGQRLATPVITLDLLPTFLAAAGAKSGDLPKNLDGIDLLPFLTGKTSKLPERPFFWRFGGSTANTAMRHGDLKLVWNRGDKDAPALFDLKADPGEKTDLSKQRPDDLARLMSELKAWEVQMIEPLWGPGSKGQPVKDKSPKHGGDEDHGDN